MQDFVDYQIYLTPTVRPVEYYWNWAYVGTLPSANLVIQNADNGTWETEEEKNALVAEASFGRAYVYNVLANTYGGVPLVEEVESSPRFDYTRASRAEVLAFAQQELTFAVEWLPEVPIQPGRAGRAAAYHLLSEVNISLGRETGDASYYSEAVTAATQVIDNPNYQLMTERFGSQQSLPGDVFSDLFRDGNQNRSSGNLETLWAYQIEYATPGGVGGARGNNWLRGWGPRFFDAKDPDNNPGFILTQDSIGRGVGWIRPTNYWVYGIWNDPSDIRNSEYNVRRDWYYNNPESAYFGQLLEPHEFFGNERDTMQLIYPMIRKVEAAILPGPDGRIYTDQVVMRLAETYLLRAEAYLLLDELEAAAADINTVRSRANAFPITAADVTLDFILDERARELTVEEQRRRTLVRTNTLVERVRKYNMRESTASSIQPYHRFFPIPQSAIDANLEADLTQNEGY